MKRRLRHRLYAALLGSLVALGIAAVVLRHVPLGFLRKTESDNVTRPHLRLGHENIPNTKRARLVVPGRPHPLPWETSRDGKIKITKRITFRCTTNSLGFRGKEVSPQKPEGVFRIFCLGDSITFGHAVADSESYPAVLERLLNERAEGKQRFEVINAGVMGYRVFQMLGLLMTRGLSYAPDLVTVCAGANDTVKAPPHSNPHLIRVSLTKQEYHAILLRLRVDLHAIVSQARKAGIGVLLMTTSAGSFFPFPDIFKLEETMVSFAEAHKVPLINLGEKFREVERKRGLVLEEEDGLQRVVSYQSGKRRVLKEVRYRDAANIQRISDEIYQFLDTHDVAQAQLVDGAHPNAPGHRFAAELMCNYLAEHKMIPLDKSDRATP